MKGGIPPPLTGIVPGLAVAAAVTFVILQVLATDLHLSCGRAKLIGLNIVLVLLAAVAAWLATIF